MRRAVTAVLSSLLILVVAGFAHGQGLFPDVPPQETTDEPPQEAVEKEPPPKSPTAKSPYPPGYVYLGLGAIGGNIEQDGGPEEGMGSGVHLLLGLNSGHLSFEFNLGTPPDNGFAGIGLKFNFMPYNEYWFTPWMGVDAYILAILTNEDRGCYAPAYGFDIRLAKGVALRLGAAHCSYTEDQSWPFAGQSVHKDMTLYTLDLIFFGN
jgi:hypothetical protein